MRMASASSTAAPPVAPRAGDNPSDADDGHERGPPSEPRLHANQGSAAPSVGSQPAQGTDERTLIPSKTIPTVTAEDGIREVPARFEHCEVEDLIQLISSMLTRLIAHNDSVPLTSNALTRFHSRTAPAITVYDYLIRIIRFTNVEPCVLLALLQYVDRACTVLANFTISSLTVHRFVIAGVACGSKALCDSFCTNSRYARVGGVTLGEMNLLEKEFLTALEWRVLTSGPVLAQYYTSLVRSHPGYRLVEDSPPESESSDEEMDTSMSMSATVPT